MNDNKIDVGKLVDCFAQGFAVLVVLCIAVLALFGLVLFAMYYTIPFCIGAGLILWFVLSIYLYNIDRE